MRNCLETVSCIGLLNLNTRPVINDITTVGGLVKKRSTSTLEAFYPSVNPQTVGTSRDGGNGPLTGMSSPTSSRLSTHRGGPDIECHDAVTGLQYLKISLLNSMGT